MENYYKKLQFYRIEQGYNYQKVEEATGISSQKLYKVEKGIEHLTVDELAILLQFYGVTLADISVGEMKKRGVLSPLLITVCALLFLGSTFFYLYKEGYMFTDDQQASSFLEEVTEIDVGNKVEVDEHKQLAQVEQENPVEIVQEDVVQEELVQGETTQEEFSQQEPIQDMLPTSVTTLRFWGDVLYRNDVQLDLGTLVNDQAFNIIPLKHVSSGEQPAWLEQLAKEQVIFKIGTTYLNKYNTREEVQKLKDLDYPVIGLDIASEVYKPYVIEKDKTRIGLLPLARIIHQVGDIAGAKHAGFPKAYDPAVVRQAVSQAKEETDFLVVLMDWGQSWGEVPEAYQRTLAQVMVEAGANLIIGNHAYFSQEQEWINDVPVFYSLGHTASEHRNKTIFNYLVEVDLQQTTLQEIRILPGKMQEGRLSLSLTADDQAAVEKRLRSNFPESDAEIPVILSY